LPWATTSLLYDCRVHLRLKRSFVGRLPTGSAGPGSPGGVGTQVGPAADGQWEEPRAFLARRSDTPEALRRPWDSCVVFRAVLYHTKPRVLKMEAKHVCQICKHTGVRLLPSEYPNFPDSRWCRECERGRGMERRANETVARTLGGRRAA